MSEITLVDLDDIELVMRVEHAFRIKIAVSEAEHCQTMGDLFAVVARKIPAVDRGAFACPAASAFWILRRAMRERVPGLHISPSTRVIHLVPARGAKTWWKELQRSTGLVLPSKKPSQDTRFITLQVPGFFRTLLPDMVGASLGAASFVLGAGGWSIVIGTTAWFVTASRLRSPEVLAMVSGATVGDFARAISALNVGLLAQRNGAIRRRDAWDAFVGVVRDFTNHPGPVDKRTRFRCV